VELLADISVVVVVDIAVDTVAHWSVASYSPNNEKNRATIRVTTTEISFMINNPKVGL